MIKIKNLRLSKGDSNFKNTLFCLAKISKCSSTVDLYGNNNLAKVVKQYNFSFTIIVNDIIN